MPEHADMLETIKAYVLEQRRKHNIKPDLQSKPEPSGEAFNEFALLLDIQLLTTVIGHGGWHELDHGPTLEGVYKEVMGRVTLI